MDNIKNQKALNRFNQGISVNKNFQYEEKKIVCEQVKASMAYEENKEGESILSKLVKINEQDLKMTSSLTPSHIMEMKKNALSTVNSVSGVSSKEMYSRSSKGSILDNEHVINSTFIDTSNAQNNTSANKYNKSMQSFQSMNVEQKNFKKNPLPDMINENNPMQNNFIQENIGIMKTTSDKHFTNSETYDQKDPLARPNRKNSRQVSSTINFESQETSSLKEGSVKNRQSGNLSEQDFVELGSVTSVGDTVYGSQKNRKYERK